MAGRRGITPADHDGGKDEGENTRPDRGQGRGGNAPPFPEGQAPEVAADDDEGHVQGPTGEVIRAHFGRAHSVEEKLKIPNDPGERAKQDDASTLGPCLVTADDIPDPQALAIRTILNDEPVQDWNTNDMIFSVAQIIEFLSASNTLPPGTVILTGTPHGVGMASKPPRWMKPGDTVTIEIEHIGKLTNPVVRESVRP